MRQDNGGGCKITKLAMMSYLDRNQSCSIEEVFSAVGHICSLSFSLGLLPPRRRNRNIKSVLKSSLHHNKCMVQGSCFLKLEDSLYPRYALYMVR